MEENNEFISVGKKMPYTVPDGFFDQLEEQVMNEVKAEPAKEKKSGKGKELAFNNLSTEDQDYLLEVYQEEEELIYDNDLNEWKNEESI